MKTDNQTQAPGERGSERAMTECIRAVDDEIGLTWPTPMTEVIAAVQETVEYHTARSMTEREIAQAIREYILSY